MKTKLILLAILSLVLFSSCESPSERRHKHSDVTFIDNVSEFVNHDFNKLKRPIIMVAKAKRADGFTSIVVKAGNDSLVNYNGKSSQLIQTIAETFNVNDTICK
jgi:hypothetical protein